ncbi:hypothetical protein [Cupriavidus sp. AcVe19-6a]|uniref:hypothetical protein n=1 Tax=Cupriavidus sp. AcVe19-6a TaxID=2821358 RepID=UPI001AEABAB5|nr:hypothetical protein [Cupriavidus sp. AcVe19-6a]MBP0635521.1 hypothetical protein [Cupriavidus sp. AcVe19-6a]
MTIQTLLNAPRLRGVIPTACGEWWAITPIADDLTRRLELLIRAYSNNAASMHCMRKTPLPVLLALLDLTIDDLRGTDGKLPDLDPGWWRHPRRYDARYPVRPMGEQ